MSCLFYICVNVHFGFNISLYNNGFSAISLGEFFLGGNELNMLNEEQIWKLVDAKRAEFIALSDRVF